MIKPNQIYYHKKSCKLYKILYLEIDSDNAEKQSRSRVCYAEALAPLNSESPVYSREQGEFLEKFILTNLLRRSETDFYITSPGEGDPKVVQHFRVCYIARNPTEPGKYFISVDQVLVPLKGLENFIGLEAFYKTIRSQESSLFGDIRY